MVNIDAQHEPFPRLRDYLRHVDYHGSESGFSTIVDDEIAELRGTANSLGFLTIASGVLELSPDGHQALGKPPC